MFAPGTTPKWWLLWAALPYAMAARLRAALYRWGWLTQQKLPVPVISIGNLTLGGTGKTPMVIRVAEWLLAEGKRIAVLSRGYHRKSREPMLLVSDGTGMLAGPLEAGDEPYLIARRCPQAIVAVGSDRYALGRWILSRFPVDCILLDDGFQHLRLYRDLDLLLVDATDLLGLEAVVPAGRLREPIEAAARATMIIVTRADASAMVDLVLARLRGAIGRLPPYAQVVFRAEGLRSILSEAQQSREWCRGRTALLCSGIGHAASFRATAEGLGLVIRREVVYADHHIYTREEVDRLRLQAMEAEAELVVTTEKDAAKLAALLTPAHAGWWAVRLETDITVGEQVFRQLVHHSSNGASVEVCA